MKGKKWQTSDNYDKHTKDGTGFKGDEKAKN